MSKSHHDAALETQKELKSLLETQKSLKKQIEQAPDHNEKQQLTNKLVSEIQALDRVLNYRKDVKNESIIIDYSEEVSEFKLQDVSHRFKTRKLIDSLKQEAKKETFNSLKEIAIEHNYKEAISTLTKYAKLGNKIAQSCLLDVANKIDLNLTELGLNEPSENIKPFIFKLTSISFEKALEEQIQKK